MFSKKAKKSINDENVLQATEEDSKRKNVTDFFTEKMLQKAQIFSLPKNVADSIPITAIYFDSADGIIETRPGVFTKAYPIGDANFEMSNIGEQSTIFTGFEELLNSFGDNVSWQILLQNETVKKTETLKKIRYEVKPDDLNKLRSDANEVLADKITRANNGITQKKYLIVSVASNSLNDAMQTLNIIETEVVQRCSQKITNESYKAFTTKERLHMIHDIYNMYYPSPFGNVRNSDGELDVDFELLKKQGYSFKDLIGPSSFEFTASKTITNDTAYSQTLYLHSYPNNLAVSFLADISSKPINMLCSVNFDSSKQSDAVELAKRSYEAVKADISTKYENAAYDGKMLASPPIEMQQAAEDAERLVDELTNDDQKMFFITFTITVFAESEEELKKNVGSIIAYCAGIDVSIKTLTFQQEFGFNASLPLAINELNVEGYYTTDMASVFMPYSSKNIEDKNAICFGINKINHKLIMFNRIDSRKYTNFNGLIFGGSGSGKSATAKYHIISSMLKNPNSQTIIIDPEGEYAPLAKALHGEIVKIAPSSNMRINPLDLTINPNDSENEEDPVKVKADFVIQMIEIIAGNDFIIDPIAKSVIGQAVTKMYQGYVERLKITGKTSDPANCPTLTDLQQILLDNRDEQIAQEIAKLLGLYVVGGVSDVFAYRTNIKSNNRLIVYDINGLGDGTIKDLGLFVCLSDYSNRMMENSKKDIWTYGYIDEFHVALQSNPATEYLLQIWKRARKRKGVPTGIMQNCSDLAQNPRAKDIIKNTNMFIMLKASPMDQDDLRSILGLEEQLNELTSPDKGGGLLYIDNGKYIIPFDNTVPAKSKLFELMNTSGDNQKKEGQ